MPGWNEFVDWALAQAEAKGGRRALRRRWAHLRQLAQTVADSTPEAEIIDLLGHPFDQLDPERNDLKALVAFGIGRGLINDPRMLKEAIEFDTRADPLHFLAQHSGKTFGEKYAPLFAKFWIARESEVWQKMPSRDHYDVLWSPDDETKIRIELKASSEYPKYLFQQIRHPRLSGSDAWDYDLLLCIGVSAGTLEWWVIPTSSFEILADNGRVSAENVVITRHHGKRRTIWNEEQGYGDEGWFRTSDNVRTLLVSFYCKDSSQLRERVLGAFTEVESQRRGTQR